MFVSECRRWDARWRREHAGRAHVCRFENREERRVPPRARTLGSKLATACATGELEGIKNVGKREVVAQGNAVDKVARILAEWYDVPSQFVDTADKLKGKGKNR